MNLNRIQYLLQNIKNSPFVNNKPYLSQALSLTGLNVLLDQSSVQQFKVYGQNTDLNDIISNLDGINLSLNEIIGTFS